VIAHPAGPRHAEVAGPDRPSAAPAADLMALEPTVWPRGTTRVAGGPVSFAGVDARELAETHGTPLMVMDEQDFRSRCREFAEAFDGAGNVHYASKAFLSGGVLRWLQEEGLGLDVCTGGELALALRAGFPAQRITLHGSNKSTAELRTAIEACVGVIVIDSFIEIARLASLLEPHAGEPISVMVRVTVGVEAHTHEFIATAHEDQKFGFSLATGDADEAVRRVLAAGSMRLVGLHSHIGSQIFDPAGFEVAAHRVVTMLARLVQVHPDLADTVTVLDLGGGMGIAYVAGDDPPAPSAMAESLSAIVERESAAAGMRVPRIVVEPGRAIVGPCGVTLYEVGTIKDVQLDGGLVRKYVSIDGGMSDNIRTALYGSEYTVAMASRSSDEPPTLCRIVGKHCESGDIIVRDCYLPGDIAVGDLVAVATTGAYCYAMASSYNRLPRPAVVSVAGGRSEVMLRRETLDDLMNLEKW
jgi:diaminopimelate decarboxylase